MATMLVVRDVDLKEVIVKTLLRYQGGARSICEIEKLLRREYHNSLDYSNNALLTAIQDLVCDGLILDGMIYHLQIKIYSRLWGRYEVKFWLLGFHHHDENESPEIISNPEMSPIPH